MNDNFRIAYVLGERLDDLTCAWVATVRLSNVSILSRCCCDPPSLPVSLSFSGVMTLKVYPPSKHAVPCFEL